MSGSLIFAASFLPIAPHIQPVLRLAQHQTQMRIEGKRRDLVEAHNTADNLIYVTEKSLNELGDKVPAAERGQIEQTIEELKSVKDSDNIDKIRTLTEQLQQASHALTQQMYQQSANGASPNGAGEPGGQASGGEDDVVEGEYRQV